MKNGTYLDYWASTGGENPMQIGHPEQFRVTDFLDWHKNKRLELNPNFQRRAVWNQDIRSYLINSLLLGFPMPKVYMRSKIDVVSQQTVREVVDGQQRIRAILDFATGQLRLNKRAGEFAGLRYDDLDMDHKQAFLSYSVSVEQLINASDNIVLEVFARLNTYSVPLNAAELRNAKFNGDFKFAVRDLATKLGWFWERYNILTVKARVRMLDDDLTAELYGILADGIKNAGKPYIDKLYSRFDARFPEADLLTQRIVEIVDYLDFSFRETLEGELFSRPPQLLILFAAVAHKLYGIPEGDLGEALPTRTSDPIDVEKANANLSNLTTAVASDPPSEGFSDFVIASTGATVRMPSRSVRFQYVWNALTDTN